MHKALAKYIFPLRGLVSLVPNERLDRSIKSIVGNKKDHTSPTLDQAEIILVKSIRLMKLYEPTNGKKI